MLPCRETTGTPSLSKKRWHALLYNGNFDGTKLFSYINHSVISLLVIKILPDELITFSHTSDEALLDCSTNMNIKTTIQKKSGNEYRKILWELWKLSRVSPF